jgi:hypothetical protein
LGESPAAAQILISAGSYRQNFNLLGGTAANWTNNVTLPGWYVSKGNGDATNYLAGSGTSTGGGVYSFGVVGAGSALDRALGAVGASGIDYAWGVRFSNDTAAIRSNITRRAAEASAISNFFVNAYLTTNALHPFLLTGDLNEDIAHPATGSQQPVQRLTNGTGLHLTTPVNPLSQGQQTFSTQGSLNRRYDYILPNGLLFSNIVSSQVFRTDLLNPAPPELNSADDAVGSDHLPVLMRFTNPYEQPFQLLAITRSNLTVTLSWQAVPGQSYHVEGSSNLASWTRLAENLLATNATSSYRTNLPDGPRYFRVSRQF